MAADAKENFKEGVNIGGDAISPIFPAVLFKDEDTGVKFPHWAKRTEGLLYKREKGG